MFDTPTCAGRGRFISPEFRGGGGFGGCKARELTDSGVGSVCVLFGGGLNLVFASVIDGGGLYWSMDRRTAGSRTDGLLSTILFLISGSSRLGGNPGRSSGRSLAERI